MIDSSIGASMNPKISQGLLCLWSQYIVYYVDHTAWSRSPTSPSTVLHARNYKKSLWIKAVDHSLNMDKLETSLQILNFMVRTKAIVKQPVQRSNNKLCFGKKYTVCWYDVCREVSERLPINGTKNFGPDKK